MCDFPISEIDGKILDELDNGRVTPALLSKRLGKQRAYLNSRLIRLRDFGAVELVEQEVPGLYHLIKDPRSCDCSIGADTDSNSNGTAQNSQDDTDNTT